MDWAQTTARRDENHLSFDIWRVLYQRLYGNLLAGDLGETHNNWHSNTNIDLGNGLAHVLCQEGGVNMSSSHTYSASNTSSHSGRNKMATILQTVHSTVFSYVYMKIHFL